MSFSLFPVAMADTASTTSHTATAGGELLLLGLLIAAFYFFIIRPQTKRQKQQQELINGLKTGDEVITAGGILGKITKLTDDFVTLAVAEQVEITLQRSAVASALPKGTIKTV